MLMKLTPGVSLKRIEAVFIQVFLHTEKCTQINLIFVHGALISKTNLAIHVITEQGYYIMLNTKLAIFVDLLVIDVKISLVHYLTLGWVININQCTKLAKNGLNMA